MQYSVSFPGGTVKYLANTPFSTVADIIPPEQCIVITDSNIARLHGARFQHFKAVIVVEAGEANKNFTSLLPVTQQLLQHGAHRKTFLLGVGGGMITDITGFVAAIYMRGLPFGFAPTSILGMVDAAVGGKNGINAGLQKNLLGTIRQPQFVLSDPEFLTTLPGEEWSNGFAEVIKYACLFDEPMFHELAGNDIQHYMNDTLATANITNRCIQWKNKVVLEDEQENDIRKLLNFGHTAGHAFETVCNIPHGHAVALGMLVACTLSEQYGLDTGFTQQLKILLKQYNLPVHIQAGTEALMHVLVMDKKRSDNHIDFIMLDKIAQPVIRSVDFDTIRKALEKFVHAGNY